MSFLKKICISKGWKLYAPGIDGGQTVDLPNDYAISQPRTADAPGGSSNGYYQGGVGRYVRYFKPETETHRILDIDGAYMLAEVSLNGHVLAMHPHGYTPFLVDLTEHQWVGCTNKLEIRTAAVQPSTRWYSGAGLYRDVFLWEGGRVRVEPRDVFVSTVRLADGDAMVKISYRITADITGTVTLRSIIPGKLDDSRSVCVRAGEKTAVEFTFCMKDARLWSTEDPFLYSLHTEITADGDLLDEADTEFGVRTISFDAKNGFCLNGKSMKLRGGCIHHDHGVLGAAAFPAAEERKVARLKAVGFNALRISHNPPSLALLQVCDRMGILVMDEAFDMWGVQKTNYDYHLWFRDWCLRDIAYMVLRDRNHPCVISYSIGNEIAEAGGFSDGYAISRMLADEVRRYDTTRPVTSAQYGFFLRYEDDDPEEYRARLIEPYADDARGCDPACSWADRVEQYDAPLDIVGYNYLYHRYEADHERYPDRVIWGSETQALFFYRSWQGVMNNAHVIGDFTWTAYDNMGEVGGGRGVWSSEGKVEGLSLADYPWRTCWQGDLDLCGYRRPQSYFREAIWCEDAQPHIFTTHPCHNGETYTGTGWHWHDVHETWNFGDEWLGVPVKAEVYTCADCVRWYLNGRLLGESVPTEAIATFDILYERGTVSIETVKDGHVCSRVSLRTVGEAASVQVVPERTHIVADRRDLAYFDITVIDKNGDRVLCGDALHCTVTGGELLGIFSGDPANEDQYTSDTCHAFEGRALAVVRTAEPGIVTVCVKADGLVAGEAAVTAE